MYQVDSVSHHPKKLKKKKNHLFGNKITYAVDKTSLYLITANKSSVLSRLAQRQSSRFIIEKWCIKLSVGATDILAEVFSGLPQSLKINALILPRL
jgi:hypothetical protein